MNVTLPVKAKKLDRLVATAAVAQLDDTAIQKMAVESPATYYAWCVNAYTAKRKAQLELEFQTALLKKLQKCDPASTETTVMPPSQIDQQVQHVGH